MATKSKILVIGATGYVGKYIAEASAKAGNPTFALIRASTLASPAKAQELDGLKSVGVTLLTVHNYIHNIMATFFSGIVIGFVNCWQIALITLATGPFIVAAGGISNIFLHRLAENIQDAYAEAATIAEQGDLNDHESLVNAVKQVDVVISTVGRHLLLDQKNIIAAIKEAGNVKRFFPSEFGNDPDRVHTVDPAKTAYANKVIIRRAIESEGIPHTYVSSNFFAQYVLPNLAQPGAKVPPREKAFIFGDGEPKVIINTEEDVANYTVKAADDPRTLNKTLYIKPPGNIYSFNELVSLWEKKIGKTLERVYIPEEQVLKKIAGAPVPVNMVLSLGHSGFVKGDQTNFEIDPSFGVEASELYPDYKYTSVDEYLTQFV